MEESNWYQKELERMEDALWHMQQRSRTLQNYRQDIQNVWNDQAAYDINGRYLNPHEESTDQILQALQQQNAVLQQAHSLLMSADHQALEVNKLSEEIVRLLEITQQELQPSYSNYDVYLDNNSAASSLLPDIHQLINQANSACEGVASCSNS